MKKLQQALMTGVSYMLPFIVLAGMTIAVTGMLTESMEIETQFVTSLNNFAWTIMDLIPAIFAAYVAYAIADKAAIAPGFIGGHIASLPVLENSASSGFLGAIVAGFVAGYIVHYMKKVSVPAFMESIKKTLFIPVLSGWLVYLLMAYPVAMTIGGLNEFIMDNLIRLSEIPQYAFLLGAILSAMCAFDMGGPMNKLAITFVFALWSDPSGVGFIVNAAVFPGIMVPALSVGIASLLAKSKYSEEEVKIAPASILSGLVGITEAALPYAFKDPLRIIGSNMLGAAVGGAIMMGYGVSTSGVSGIFGLPMATDPLVFILAIIVGISISVTVQIIWKKSYNETSQITNNGEDDLDFEITM
ncbi:PTS fructose transporter subunit IIC [Oceanobacillus kapialis]|uniref:PTS fructose transporter subunit IIC n=1 Tax=Oceanobacillus kapialis TaxID=481353 RepID=A0ABW5PZF9_9BACI